MFNFLPFSENHLPHLRHWLNQEHVKKFWQESSNDQKLSEKFLIELPRRGVWPFVIEHKNREIGYIQYYDATKVGDGWWLNETSGTFGIDLMIGQPELLGQGIGPQVITEFISFTRKREPTVESIIIDPDPNNKIAIRAFEKAGFRTESEIETPGGPALLMRIRLS
ncbi:MAG: GNAT family N-acetyltransferase [Bdellovibrionota bacterium]